MKATLTTADSGNHLLGRRQAEVARALHLPQAHGNQRFSAQCAWFPLCVVSAKECYRVLPSAGGFCRARTHTDLADIRGFLQLCSCNARFCVRQYWSTLYYKLRGAVKPISSASARLVAHDLGTNL